MQYFGDSGRHLLTVQRCPTGALTLAGLTHLDILDATRDFEPLPPDRHIRKAQEISNAEYAHDVAAGSSVRIIRLKVSVFPNRKVLS